MKLFVASIVFILFHSSVLFAQYVNPEQRTAEGIVTRAIIVNGDTLPLIRMREVVIVAPRLFRNKKDAIEWTRLVRNVKKVYPYAKLAGQKMKEYNEMLRPIESKSERRRLIRELEDQLFQEFEKDIRSLTVTQGKILMKLIDRETSKTTYDIIREYRGSIMAGFWQITGSIFGYNLKEPYDPEGKDREIEVIVQMIESGIL